MGIQNRHDGASLKCLGAIGKGCVGFPKEDQIGDIDVEMGDEWADEFVPLPHCVCSHAMDQNQIGLSLFGGFGDPAVHDGAVAEIGGGGFKTHSGEIGTVPGFHDRSVSETLAGHCNGKFEYRNKLIEE